MIALAAKQTHCPALAPKIIMGADGNGCETRPIRARKKALCFQCSWRNRAAGNWRFLLPLSERYRIGVVAKRQHGVSRFDTRVTGTREEKRLLVGDGLIAR